MSVLACNRYRCNNIMCDRLSSEHGYICDDCFDELIASNGYISIEDFMNTGKTPEYENTFWVEYVNNEFKLNK